MNYLGLKSLTASGSLFTIVYQAARAFITRALFIFYTRESSSIVSRAASFLSTSFRLSELPRTAEKNTVTTILRWLYVYRRQILRRVKTGIHELHHKRSERLYRHCENSTRGRFLPFANISPRRVSSNVDGQEIRFAVYVLIYCPLYNASSCTSCVLTFDNDTKLSSLIT